MADRITDRDEAIEATKETIEGRAGSNPSYTVEPWGEQSFRLRVKAGDIETYDAPFGWVIEAVDVSDRGLTTIHFHYTGRQ